ncbi:hypothetical protein BC830DRAFT_1113301 [Chytriomyces sp. MP71]|nr:hypothetical protein BC830DRAFT_1113301 [Chytriomyces sp. MP71]
MITHPWTVVAMTFHQHPFIGQCVSRNRRMKSCEPCRLQKKKCSLGEVCERCRQYGIVCQYTNNSTKSKAFFALKKTLKVSSMKMPASNVVTKAAAGSQPFVNSVIQLDSNRDSKYSAQTPIEAAKYELLPSIVSPPWRPSSPAVSTLSGSECNIDEACSSTSSSNRMRISFLLQ